MSAQVFDLFPLSILKDKISFSAKEKNLIIDHIFKLEKKTENINKIYVLRNI